MDQSKSLKVAGYIADEACSFCLETEKEQALFIYA